MSAARLGVAVFMIAAATVLSASSGVQAAADASVSISSVSASFFPNSADSGAFTSGPATPVTFTQEFPGINFNPPQGTIACNKPTGVSNATRPFTDVVPQPDGSCQVVVAQGNKQQAGAADMAGFQAVFSGSLVVSSGGRVTFNMFSDDGWIFSIGPSSSGAQPPFVSGPMLNFPRVGPFTGYPIVGSYNLESSANQNNLVVGFPATGSYPFELDYSECCGGDLALTMTANGAPIPPIAALAIDVKGLA